MRIGALIALVLPGVNLQRGGCGNILPGAPGPADDEKRHTQVDGEGGGAVFEVQLPLLGKDVEAAE